MINTELKVNALVKQNELDCYDWIHEEGLCVVTKITTLDEEHKIYLFQAYNMDRDEWGGVTSDQIIITDNSILDLHPLMEDCNVICGDGEDVRGGIKFSDKED